MFSLWIAITRNGSGVSHRWGLHSTVPVSAPRSLGASHHGLSDSPALAEGHLAAGGLAAVSNLVDGIGLPATLVPTGPATHRTVRWFGGLRLDEIFVDSEHARDS